MYSAFLGGILSNINELTLLLLKLEYSRITLLIPLLAFYIARASAATLLTLWNVLCPNLPCNWISGTFDVSVVRNNGNSYVFLNKFSRTRVTDKTLALVCCCNALHISIRIMWVNGAQCIFENTLKWMYITHEKSLLTCCQLDTYRKHFN